MVATGARPRQGVVGYRALRAEREADPGPTLLLFGTGWGLASIVCYVVAVALSLAVVVPALQRAGGTEGRSPLYGRIAASSGIVSLLLLAVTVLMVWRP